MPQDILDSITPPTFDDNDTMANDSHSTQTTASPITATTVNPNAGLITPELLEEIKDVSCPEDCSGHGTCVNGTFKLTYFATRKYKVFFGSEPV